MRGRTIAAWIALAAGLAASTPACTTMRECNSEDSCREDSDCPRLQECNDCMCEPVECISMSDCTEDADCAAGSVCNPMITGDGWLCRCEGPPTPLTPSGLATLTGSGLASSAHFEEIEGCPGPSSFDAPLVVTVAIPGADGTSAMETVQQPGDQRSTGTLRADLTFVLRDASSTYDETYIGRFERTAGTDPSAPLTADTVVARGVNVNGAEGLLASVDDARVDAAIGAGLFDATQPAALSGLLDGVTGACVLGFDVVLQP